MTFHSLELLSLVVSNRSTSYPERFPFPFLFGTPCSQSYNVAGVLSICFPGVILEVFSFISKTFRIAISVGHAVFDGLKRSWSFYNFLCSAVHFKVFQFVSIRFPVPVSILRHPAPRFVMLLVFSATLCLYAFCEDVPVCVRNVSHNHSSSLCPAPYSKMFMEFLQLTLQDFYLVCSRLFLEGFPFPFLFYMPSW